MATSSAVLPNLDEDTTAVVRYAPQPADGATQTFVLPQLPTLTGLPLPPGIPPASIQVPGYEIIRELGRGGMGVVYLARQRKLDRFVALKMVLARQYAGPEDQFRFRQEVEAVAKLNHPNIAQVYEVGEHDGFAFAAFEYVDGGTLLAWQKDKQIAPPVAARMIITLARAVQHAHDHGIIHRDLKPANILLQKCGTTGKDSTHRSSSSILPSLQATVASLAQTPNPAPNLPIPKISDFGLAKRIDGAAHLTATGMACGTPNYMAPEQIRGKQGEVGPAADVYGLGAILFELLAAKPPFRCDTPMETMQAVLTEPAPGLARLRADVPQDLDVIAAKCLEKEPGRRYASASELADDLERHLENRPILARGIGPLERGRRWIARNPLATILIVTFMLGFAATFSATLLLWRTIERERVTAHEREVAFQQMRLARDEATTQKAIAETRQAEAEAAKKRADRHLQDAEASASRAAESLNLATTTVDTLLARFATDPRFQDADFLSLRQDLLRDASNLYGQLQKQGRDQPQLEHHSLRAQYFLGLLARVAGKIEPGDAHIEDALRRFAKLLAEHPTQHEWQLEFAHMHLDEIDRARQDGETARRDVIHNLNTAESALAAFEVAEKPSEEIQARLDIARLKANVARVFLASLKSPEQEGRLAAAALPLAEELRRARPRDADVIDLYGKLLLHLAQAAARAGDPAAECYFTAAVEHYQAAIDASPASLHYNRWHVRFALARQAHGLHLDDQGLYDFADLAFANTRTMLESALDYAPELGPQRLDLAEAYLHIIRRMRKLHPKFNPHRMIDMLDVRLAPFWNAGAPTDRARRVLTESKVLGAQWFAENGHPVDSGNSYTQAGNFAMYELKNGQGREFRALAGRWWSQAAYQYAIGRQPTFAKSRIALAEKQPSLAGEDWFTLARTWNVLALSNPDNPEVERLRAVDALEQADKEGYFRDSANRKRFDSDADYAKLRQMFEPKND